MPPKKAVKQKESTFKRAVLATPDVANCWQAGLQALLKDHRQKIELADASQCEGSVDIDKCTADKRLYLNENRWDYVFGYQKQAYFVEVHSANTSEVRTVLNKLQWLKDWLQEHAPEINAIKAPQPFYWIQSGKFAIARNSPQFRLINQNGLLPVSKLKL